MTVRIPKRKWLEGKAAIMRKEPSYLEKRMIEILDDLGVTYYFQVPWRKRYILDFWIPQGQINIECDGFHFHKDRTEKDAKRDRFLRLTSKMKVLRFPSSMFKDCQLIETKIRAAMPICWKPDDPLTREFKMVTFGN